MKALLSRQAGGPESLVLEDVPEPVPGRGEVRVKVRAVGVNFPDLLIIQDLYQIKPPRPFAPGGELSGVVELLGEGVTNVKVGDRVLVSPVRSAMAEKAIANANNCWKIPDTMPFDEASALLLTYGTSQHALQDRARLRAGETLLVLGAAGGVGLAAVELGKAMGARVIAAASSADKLALAREHGADDGVQYPVGPLDKTAAIISRQPAARMEPMSSMTESVAITPKRHCVQSLGLAATWSWASRPAFRSCRSICRCSRAARSSASSGVSSPIAFPRCTPPMWPRSWRCIWMVK
jgi:NADPH:quinone reductase-like Zn-dependent oxidoreductase